MRVKIVATIFFISLTSWLHAQNVGIGTTSPTHPLHVVGTVRFESLAPNGGNSGLIIVDPIGVLSTLTFPNDTTLFLSGDGTWKHVSGGDNWGAQTAVTTHPVVGDGTAGSPITIASGTANNDILVWDGTQWTISQFVTVATNNNIFPLCSGINTNSVLRFTGSSLCNSLISDNGTSVGIGTVSPSSSAILELNSTNQGFLMPRLTTAQRNNINNPAHGLLIMNTDNFCIEAYDATSSSWLEVSCPQLCSPCDTCPLPQINSVVANPTQDPCPPIDITLHVNATNATTYIWNAKPVQRWQVISLAGDSAILRATGMPPSPPITIWVYVSACNECGCVTDSTQITIGFTGINPCRIGFSSKRTSSPQNKSSSQHFLKNNHAPHRELK
ncbi:MAG: hypothetical protein GXO48_02715 [Chlorobi bacterium]|nr:hypothetical protein [Chlorobiota bacterium]